MEQIYTPKQNYKVLVRCFTYNQSKYIEDALNGFAMQKTDFPFACLVMDDCSTDGEQEVIKAWMERECDMEMAEHIDLELSNVILVPHKINENCSFAFYLLKRNLWGKGDIKRTLVDPWRKHCEYEAICEGDDYWTDLNKLRTQVSFLDRNEHCILTYHACVNKFESNLKKEEPVGETVAETYNMNDILNRYCFQTATVVHRMSALDTDIYQKAVQNQIPNGDVYLYLSACSLGEIHGFDKKMSVYRRTSTGVSVNLHKKNGVYKSTLKWIDYANCLDRDTSHKIHETIIYHRLLHNGPSHLGRLLYKELLSNPKTFFRVLMNLPKLAIDKFL